LLIRQDILFQRSRFNHSITELTML